MAIKGLDIYDTDADFEREGVWFDFGDFQIRAARSGGANDEYLQAFAKALKPYMRLVNSQGVGIPPKIQRKIAIDVVSKTCIKAWTLTEVDEHGNSTPIPCTVEKRIEIFTRYPDLFTQMQQFIDDKDNYLRSLREDMAGN